MPYEDEPFDRSEWRDPDVEAPVVWRKDVSVEQIDELFEQEHAAKPDPALEELERHLDETWASIAHLYEED